MVQRSAFFFTAKKFTLPEVNNKVPGQNSSISETCDFNTESKYDREDFYFVGRFHGSAVHGGRCVACFEAYADFTDESACLTANNVRKEGKFLPYSQNTGDVENAVPLHVDIPRTVAEGSDLPFEAVLQE
jgi:hypothetical protein